MNRKLIYNNWEIIKDNLERDFKSLQSKDLEALQNNQDELITHIMKETKQSKEEVLYLIYSYINNSESDAI